MNIVLDEIRSKAPNGATHFNGSDYFKSKYGVTRMFNTKTGKWDKVPHHYMNTSKPL